MKMLRKTQYTGWPPKSGLSNDVWFRGPSFITMASMALPIKNVAKSCHERRKSRFGRDSHARCSFIIKFLP